jgi:hemoglobin
MKPDIQTEADIATVVDAFYGTITDDPVLGLYFAEVDMQAHRPKLCAFWSSVVFRTGTYRGRPFDAHLQLEGLAARHFTSWLQRFHSTVDAHFAGDTAEQMKRSAEQIAGVFQAKLVR